MVAFLVFIFLLCTVRVERVEKQCECDVLRRSRKSLLENDSMLNSLDVRRCRRCFPRRPRPKCRRLVIDD